MILPPATLGMLGGGQLGRFFVMAAQEMGYRVVVLDPDRHSPAGRIANEHLTGQLRRHFDMEGQLLGSGIGALGCERCDEQQRRGDRGQQQGRGVHRCAGYRDCRARFRTA